MAKGPQVDVLIFKDQNGHSAEVFQSPAKARQRAIELIENELNEISKHYGPLEQDVAKDIRRMFTIPDLGDMVFMYDKLRREYNLGDASERMVAVKAPFVR